MRLGRFAMDLDAVARALVSRAPIFHRGRAGVTRADFEATAAAADFWEVGASGSAYGRGGRVARARVPGRVRGA